MVTLVSLDGLIGRDDSRAATIRTALTPISARRPTEIHMFLGRTSPTLDRL